MSHSGAKVHAVVWCSAGKETPADLVRALQKQGISWEEAFGPFDAFARLLTSRAAKGLVLLLVEPAQLRGADKVRSALEHFVPATGCWAYQAHKNPRLAPLASPPASAEPEIVVRPTKEHQSKPKLKLAGNGSCADRHTPAKSPQAEHEPVLSGENTEKPPFESESPRSVLTPEELAMLLADDRESEGS